LPLQGNVIDISGNLSQTKTGTIEETYEIPNPKKDQNSDFSNSFITAAIFFIPLIPLVVFTKNDYTTLSQTEKEVKKIMKKYGEWIVEVDKAPQKPTESEVIYMKTLDDLVKASEEIGKPVIHYSSNLGRTHTFHVLDSTARYEYVISEDEKIKKTVRCPDCTKKIECEGKPGKTMYVECPDCGKKGEIEL